jgi:fructuronate reductase
MAYVTGIDEKGNAIDVRDPLRDVLRAKADTAGRDAAKLAPALFSVVEIFGQDLPADAAFTTAVTRSLDSLFSIGSRRTYEAFRSSHS